MLSEYILLGLLAYSTEVYANIFAEEDWQKHLLPQDYKSSLAPKGDMIDVVSATDNFMHEALMVSAMLSIESITSISESTMEFTADLAVILKWTDNRLNTSAVPYDRSDGGILLTKPNKIWRPQVYVANNRVRDREILTDSRSIVMLNKQQLEVYAWFPVRVFCPFKFYDYPFDVQSCSIRFQCDKDPRDVTIKFDTTDSTPVHQGSPSLLLDVDNVERAVCGPSEASGNFSCLSLNIVFKRRLSTHITQTFIPSILIVVLSWFSFWLDVDSAPARISLGVTALLTLTTSFAQTQHQLPSVSYMKALDLWMFACVVVVFLSLVEFTAAYTVEKSQSSVKKQNVVRNPYMDRPYYVKIKSQPRNQKLLGKTASMMFNKIKNVRGLSVDQVARITFPTIFILFMVTYWVYYLHKRSEDD